MIHVIHIIYDVLYNIYIGFYIMITLIIIIKIDFPWNHHNKKMFYQSYLKILFFLPIMVIISYIYFYKLILNYLILSIISTKSVCNNFAYIKYINLFWLVSLYYKIIDQFQINVYHFVISFKYEREHWISKLSNRAQLIWYQ